MAIATSAPKPPADNHTAQAARRLTDPATRRSWPIGPSASPTQQSIAGRKTNVQFVRILFSNLSMRALCAFFFLRLRLPLFSSNSVVHDGVGWVCDGKVETAIGRFRLLLQNRRRVSRPPSDVVPFGSSDKGNLAFVVVEIAAMRSGIQSRHASSRVG